jgi:hypothetical protein
LDILAIFLIFFPALIAPEKPWQNATFRYNKANQFRSQFLMSFIDWDAISGDG